MSSRKFLFGSGLEIDQTGNIKDFNHDEKLFRRKLA
jgi:hypothetical protein